MYVSHGAASPRSAPAWPGSGDSPPAAGDCRLLAVSPQGTESTLGSVSSARPSHSRGLHPRDLIASQSPPTPTATMRGEGGGIPTYERWRHADVQAMTTRDESAESQVRHFYVIEKTKVAKTVRGRARIPNEILISET